MEEIARVVGYNVELECNEFLRRRVDDLQSDFQHVDIPIPKYPRVDDDSVTFMGRVVADVVRVTDPSQTMYLMPMSAWYASDGSEVMGIRQFSLLRRAMDVPGLWGIDRILCFMAVHSITRAISIVRAAAATDEDEESAAKNRGRGGNRSVLPAAIQAVATREQSGVSLPFSWYTTTVAQLDKVFSSVNEQIVSVGQYQLIRRQLASEVLAVGRLESTVFVDSLRILNERLLAATIAGDDRTKATATEDGSEQQHKLGAEGETLASVSRFLEAAGLHSPLLTIFAATDPMEALPLFLALFLISHLGRYVYDPHLSTLSLKSRSGGKAGGHDIVPIVVGVLTLLKQFHFEYTRVMIKELGVYVQVAVEHHCGGASGAVTSFGASTVGGGGSSFKAKAANSSGSLPHEVINLIVIVDLLRTIGGVPRAVIEDFLPAFLLDTAFD